MKKVLPTETIPLATDADGVIRVGGTRVTLDTVIAAYQDGATAEEVVERYPTLNLGDVYTVFGYYIHHEAEVESYLKKRRKDAERVRAENESRHSPIGVRARLLARRRTG